MGLISPLAKVFLFVISCKGDIGGRGGRFPWCPWENPAHQWWSLVISFQGIFPRHLMEKVGEEKVGDLVPRLHHHMRKKTYVQKITLSKSLQVLENLNFWYIYTKKSDASLLPFSFWRKPCYFRVSHHQPSKLASMVTTLLHVGTPACMFQLVDFCLGIATESVARDGTHLLEGFLSIGIFGARKKITKRKHWFLLEGFWSTGFLWVIFKSGLF